MREPAKGRNIGISSPLQSSNGCAIIPMAPPRARACRPPTESPSMQRIIAPLQNQSIRKGPGYIVIGLWWHDDCYRYFTLDRTGLHLQR